MLLRFRQYVNQASDDTSVSLPGIAIGGIVKHLKKMMFATLAALMVAGGLCSISGANSLSLLSPIAVVGEGVSPLPVVQAPVADQDTTSSMARF
ncbi:MAG TPA: hypothetical protein VKB58_10465 [Terriglobales bacterium]|jgi:hypothetical protein|nr:hypothetical protein [Terriglobales bacterium]